MLFRVSAPEDPGGGPSGESRVCSFSNYPGYCNRPCRTTQRKAHFTLFHGGIKTQLEPLMPALVRIISEVPSNLFFWVMMLITPPVPSASYLADGEVMTSTDFISSAGIV